MPEFLPARGRHAENAGHGPSIQEPRRHLASPRVHLTRSDGSTIRLRSTPAPEPLGHVPALDGMRAVAVVAVMVFHGGFAVADGGFLGVSVFFTLSGFLITSLVLREWSATDGIDLRSFWSRRFRRLLAASWLTMALVVVMGALGAWDHSQMRDLRGDVPWSLAELANWHLIAKGTSYGASQSPPSPLEHFWSLAIEQQFYILLPLLLVGLLVRGRGTPRRRLRSTLGVLAALGVASAVANGWFARTSIDRAYFGTDTRAAELIAGVLLAGFLLRRLRLHGRIRQLALVAGAVGSVVLVALFHLADLTSRWLYPWGLLLTAACSAAVVVASLQNGPISRVLSLAPLVAIGRVSYGLYLLHWPVFLWLTPARTGLDSPGAEAIALFALRMAVTSVAAIAMFRWIEQPVRSRRMLTTSQARVAVPCAAVLLLISNFAVTSGVPDEPDYLRPREPGDVDIREAPVIAAPTTTTEPPPTSAPLDTTQPPTALGATVPAPSPAPSVAPPPPTTPPSRHPRRVLLVGDSVAASLQDGLGDALQARGITFATAAAPGCGVVTGDPADAAGNALSFTSACNGAIPGLQTSSVAKARPDLVVAMSSWESSDRIVAGRWYEFGTPDATSMLHQLYGATIGRLSGRGAKVLLVNVAEFVAGESMPVDHDANRRGALLNQIIADIGANAPGVDSFDLDGLVCPTSPCPTTVDGIVLRPRDGRHFAGAAAQRWVGERMADQIAALDLDRM